LAGYKYRLRDKQEMPILIEEYGMYFRKWIANVWTVFAAGSQRIKASVVLNKVTLSVGYLKSIKTNSAKWLIR
jgi:hypothetical protein